MVQTLTSTILLIEDEYNLRQSLQLILKHAGYMVETLQNCSEAVDILGKGEIGLIILSIHNSDNTALSQLFYIRASFPHIPIMVLAANETPLLDWTTCGGAAVYLTKPVDPNLILAHITDIFGGHS
jgi:DNA-binding response OmpR family regulator